MYNWRLLRLLLSQKTAEFCELPDKHPPITSMATYCALMKHGGRGGGA